MPHDSSSVEDMDGPQGGDAGEEILRQNTEGTDVTDAEGLKLQHGRRVELQQQGLTQLQMPGLGIEFGLELMRQRAEQLEKLPSMAMEGQLPVGPLP